jgi:aryl-alcohol dehydrogenase-like predicted oxidoreductase
MTQHTKSLGLGLIGIGRIWGVAPTEVPSEREALEFLSVAYEAGIRYFDTAPSYGTSEERLGKFLSSLTSAERATITVATKFGEHWDSTRNEPYVDHSFDALRASLDRSLARLGSVDILQLHKTTPEVLSSADLDKAWDYALTAGIQVLGPSVSDLESARIACTDPRYRMLQLPLNTSDGRFLPLLPEIAAAGLWIAVNRPFAMGRSIGRDSFRYLLDLPFNGVILSGTKSREHLRDNIAAFHAA